MAIAITANIASNTHPLAENNGVAAFPHKPLTAISGPYKSIHCFILIKLKHLVIG